MNRVLYYLMIDQCFAHFVSSYHESNKNKIFDFHVYCVDFYLFVPSDVKDMQWILLSPILTTTYHDNISCGEIKLNNTVRYVTHLIWKKTPNSWINPTTHTKHDKTQECLIKFGKLNELGYFHDNFIGIYSNPCLALTPELRICLFMFWKLLLNKTRNLH